MKNKPLIIGLTGPAGSGKDSVADAIVHLTNAGRMAFADALRAEVCAAFGVPVHYLTARECKELPIGALALDRCMDPRFVERIIEVLSGADLQAPRSPRQIMQWWGTDYRRASSIDYWTSRVITRARQRIARAQRRCFVITDVRFADEAQAVRELGGVIWRVVRPGYGVAWGEHVSETTGAEFSPELTICNDGTLSKLQHSVWGSLALTTSANFKRGVAA
jgi:hypothetical protein